VVEADPIAVPACTSTSCGAVPSDSADDANDRDRTDAWTTGTRYVTGNVIRNMPTAFISTVSNRAQSSSGEKSPLPRVVKML
jgi:hypothetical protein